MKKFIYFIFFILLFLNNKNLHAESNETLYDKIDLFSEVLNKIEEEYVTEIKKY